MKKTILNHEYIEKEITTNQEKDFRYRWSHGATDKHIGDGMILYSLMYFFKPKVSVCLGSGNGYIPRIMSKVNDDIENLSVDVTCYEDAESEEYISDDEYLC